MTEQINHAEEARRLIADETLEVTLPGDEWELFAAAQVHATLALAAATERVAEQGRIKNLLDLAQFRAKDTEGNVLVTSLAGAREMRAAAHKGLGL